MKRNLIAILSIVTGLAGAACDLSVDQTAKLLAASRVRVTPVELELTDTLLVATRITKRPGPRLRCFSSLP